MLADITDRLCGLLWGEFTILLILACGVLHTVKSGFVQLRLPILLVREKKGKNRLKAVTSALGASMGTGNITGCAAAVASGGAGAVFWMWVSAFFGMALAYSENRLGAEYGIRYKGTPQPPMLYIEKILGARLIAVLYAAGCICTAFAMGCMSQSGAFCAAISAQTGIGRLTAAIILAIMTAAVIFSSKSATKSVMSVSEKLVPVMGALYAVCSVLLLIGINADIGAIFGEIFSCALTPQAAAGGAAGIAIKNAVSVGLRRGVFSNEAGMGSSVLVHSEADFGSPESAGAWAAFEVFLDTMVCCTLTALVVIASKRYTDPDITQIFSSVLGSGGGALCCASVCMFAFAAMLGWCCYGEKCLDHLCRRKSAGNIYRLLFCLAAAAGGVMSERLLIGLADIFNVLIMFPNLLSITVGVLTERSTNRR